MTVGSINAATAVAPQTTVTFKGDNQQKADLLRPLTQEDIYAGSKPKKKGLLKKLVGLAVVAGIIALAVKNKTTIVEKFGELKQKIQSKGTEVAKETAEKVAEKAV